MKDANTCKSAEDCAGVDTPVFQPGMFMPIDVVGPVERFKAAPYTVYSGIAVWLSDRNAYGIGYGVVNDTTGIIELERTNLPEAVIVAKRMSTLLESAFNTDEDEVALKAPPVPSQAQPG